MQAETGDKPIVKTVKFHVPLRNNNLFRFDFFANYYDIMMAILTFDFQIPVARVTEPHCLEGLKAS